MENASPPPEKDQCAICKTVQGITVCKGCLILHQKVSHTRRSTGPITRRYAKRPRQTESVSGWPWSTSNTAWKMLGVILERTFSQALLTWRSTSTIDTSMPELLLSPIPGPASSKVWTVAWRSLSLTPRTNKMARLGANLSRACFSASVETKNATIS
jgi:hypothetical protein